MRATYAVNWKGPSGRTRSGKLELRSRSVLFEGLNGEGSTASEIPYGDISAVRVERAPCDRLGGRPTLVVERRSGPPIRIASIAQPGIVSELAEHLATLHVGEQRPVSRVLVIIPLRQGSHDQVWKLVQAGPPFDPDAAGLERHHVFLTDHEAVFVFEGETPETIGRLVADTSVWAAASAWKELVAGPPRVAEDAYTMRPEPHEGLSFAPTPGAGDSEGGDLYSP